MLHRLQNWARGWKGKGNICLIPVIHINYFQQRTSNPMKMQQNPKNTPRERIYHWVCLWIVRLRFSLAIPVKTNYALLLPHKSPSSVASHHSFQHHLSNQPLSMSSHKRCNTAQLSPSLTKGTNTQHRTSAKEFSTLSLVATLSSSPLEIVFPAVSAVA